MEHFQPFVAGQRLGLHTEGFEIIEDVRLNPIQLGPVSYTHLPELL